MLHGSHAHLVSAAGAALVAAGAFGGPPTSYTLLDKSAFLKGCFPPCACPITLASLEGGFDLEEVQPLLGDPWYTVYAVTDVELVAYGGADAVEITGSGTYTVGGQFAYLQRMELDLAVDGEPFHFDSGWQGVSVIPPYLDIDLSVNGMVCYDIVLELFAVQSGLLASDLDGDGAVGGSDLAILLAAWGPCPRGTACSADLTGDGKVNGGDLSILLAEWTG